MKSILFLILSCLALLSPLSAYGEANGWNPQISIGTANPSNTSTQGNRGNMYLNTANKSVWVKTDDFTTTNWYSINGGNTPQQYFSRTCFVVASVASAAVPCLAAGDVGTAQAPYVTNFHALVNGGTGWNNNNACLIQDTSASAITFASIGASAMTANAVIFPNTASVAVLNAFNLGSGGTAGAGLNLVCTTTGNGSSLVVTIEGYLK